MITQQSGIRILSAAKGTHDRRLDASSSKGFVNRLGDIKIETKAGGKTDVIDGPMVTDRFPL